MKQPRKNLSSIASVSTDPVFTSFKNLLNFLIPSLSVTFMPIIGEDESITGTLVNANGDNDYLNYEIHTLVYTDNWYSAPESYPITTIDSDNTFTIDYAENPSFISATQIGLFLFRIIDNVITPNDVEEIPASFTNQAIFSIIVDRNVSNNFRLTSMNYRRITSDGEYRIIS